MSTNIAARTADISKTRTSGALASLHVDAKDGALLVADLGGRRRTYSATAVITPAASATDILTITGAANKRVEIKSITISGAQTTAGLVAFDLIRRSAVNTGGTSAAVTPTKYEVADAAASAAVASYSANASGLGASAGVVRTVRVPIGTATGAVPPTTITFGNGGKPIVLASATEILALNLKGATVSGGSLDVNVEFVESTESAS